MSKQTAVTVTFDVNVQETPSGPMTGLIVQVHANGGLARNRAMIAMALERARQLVLEQELRDHSPLIALPGGGPPT